MCCFSSDGNNGVCRSLCKMLFLAFCLTLLKSVAKVYVNMNKQPLSSHPMHIPSWEDPSYSLEELQRLQESTTTTTTTTTTVSPVSEDVDYGEENPSFLYRLLNIHTRHHANNVKTPNPMYVML
uniref:Uncharacterized protein n=1 Tax=Schizaphis graminum TaxID=13262 RepID=A0A2S2N8J2_SCHGA